MKELERQIDPPEMSIEDENIYEQGSDLLYSIHKLYDTVQNFFEELTVKKIESLLSDAEYCLEQMREINAETNILDDQCFEGSSLVEEIEGLLHQKMEDIKHEDK